VPYRTMDNRIDGAVLSVMSEMGSFSVKQEGTIEKVKGAKKKTKSRVPK
jgi:hypothetical protein